MFVGIDIGSSNSKLALLNKDGDLIFTHHVPTGISSKNSISSLLQFIEQKGYSIASCRICSTGYGRDNVEIAEKKVTEITCHAAGASHIFNKKDFTLIDIGGQDTKVIEIQDKKVENFAMNDKCSAGTGRFLDVMARIMGRDVFSMIEMARKGEGSTVSISSLCTVFAESEVISLIGKSVREEEIAYAIVNSIAQKVSSQFVRLGQTKGDVILTGGLCSCTYFGDVLSKVLKRNVITSALACFAGAIGAALMLC